MGEDHWPHFVTGEYASRTQPMPFAESAQVPVFDFSDDFTGATLRPEWSWNYPCLLYTSVIPFATSGSSSISNAESELRKAYPDVNWQKGKLMNGVTEEDIKNWTKK